jgi:hypothetical protein
VKADAAHAHRTVQRGSHRPCHDVPQQERHADKSRETEQRYYRTDRYADLAYGPM